MSFNGWKEYKLGDIIDVKHGYAFKGEFFSKTPTTDILLTPGNFKIGGGFKEDKFKYYSGAFPKDYVLAEGDIIVTMTDLSKEADTLGYSAKIPPHTAINYLHNQRLGLVKFKSLDFDKDFIYWLLRTKPYQLFIANSATGTTVRHTAPSRIKEYEFSAPSKLIQTKIASILSSLDDKIELNRQTNQTLEAMAQVLFTEMCLPKGEGLPAGWRVGKLGDIMVNFDSKRKPLSSRERQDRKGIYPYYGAASIVDYIDDYIFEGVHLLMGEDGTVITKDEKPVLQYVTGKFWVNNHTHVLRGKEPYSTEFLLLLLKQTNIKHLVTGAVQPKINQGNLNSLEVIVPDDATVLELGQLVQPIFQMILECEEENQTLTYLRDGLLPKLMKGEIM